MTRSHFASSGQLAASPVKMSAPALLTQASTRPNAPRACSRSAATSAARLTSARAVTARRPRPVMAPVTASASARELA